MDESWRMRMGMPSTTQLNHPRRRSVEDISHSRRNISTETDNFLLEPEDFKDVFGGPPRIVMSRQFSGHPSFSRSSFFEEVFRPVENAGHPGKAGGDDRRFPEFEIPGERGSRRNDQGFYSDIFGWDEEVVRRSRTKAETKSKASSSSVLSSEDLSPLQAAIGSGRGNGTRNDDVSVFASRLRPINVPSRWNSTRVVQEGYQRQQDCPISWNNIENCFNDNFRSSHSELFPGNSSPETINLDPSLYRVVKTSTDDCIPNSPSSAVSSICEDHESMACKAGDEIMHDQEIEVEEDEDEDEVMNSYVIEINSENKEVTDYAVGVDDAIAWAKETFQKHCSENTWSTKHDEIVQFAEAQKMVCRDQIPERRKIDGPGSTQVSEMETEVSDENVRLWSIGKEADIRLLLSTLHHILWTNSGWSPIPLATLIESSHVKKAYQKARLCLHPDKLQQRGATCPQKYLAKRVFSIIQEAWATFISQDVS